MESLLSEDVNKACELLRRLFKAGAGFALDIFSLSESFAEPFELRLAA